MATIARRACAWVLLFGLVAGSADCARATTQPVAGITLHELTSEQLTTYHVARIDGVVVGPVDGVVINTDNGATEYVVVLLKDLYNFGKGAAHGPQNKYLLVPWSAVRLDAAHALLIVTVDAARLEAAPVLNALPDTTQPDWDAAIRDYWAAAE